ncbi:MAG TPA: fasciclin domain-containing protein, partial [Acidimicrobiia bacterium]
EPEQDVETLQGGELLIEVGDDDATITDGQEREATIVVTDVKASNGVIHVIDRVLLPDADATE